ncbi:glutamine synthetase [Escherichia coli]|nr:glutamine synthetase [Salmonella enterica subsp. enterica]EFG8199767.1 glutamine synthetase [Escherichia coli]
MTATSDFADWVSKNPKIKGIHAAICDLNGAWRGKFIPGRNVAKALTAGIRMPLSAPCFDIWGEDQLSSASLALTGDGDGHCISTGRGPLVIDDLSGSALLPLWTFRDDGTPLLSDPRQALASVVRRFEGRRLRPVVAVELEFYLVRPRQRAATPPISQRTGRPLDSDAILSVDELDLFGPFLNDVYARCAEVDIAADAAIAENGIGQFEINLQHCDDPLRAADDAALLKRVIKTAARKHGYVATFMAKPYGERAGSGMHVHASFADEAGRNVFDDGSARGSDLLGHAVAGMLAGMVESTLIFAPHLNSYRRLRPDTHAPTRVSWGFENRTTAIRIPGGSSGNRRVEHRVAGADANPYLVLAAVLGGALAGIEASMVPPSPITGRVHSIEDCPRLAPNWSSAIDVFEHGPMAADIFDAELRSALVACKRREAERFERQLSQFEYDTYLESA